MTAQHDAPHPVGFDGQSYDPKELPSVYRHGDLVVYRASGFGSCIKELVATRCGFPPAPFPPKFDKIFADGHRGEAVIIDALEAQGWRITNRQDTIEFQALPNVVIRCHADGIAWHDDLCPEGAIFDAKTTSARYGIAPALMEKYETQVSIEGHALGIPRCVFGVGEKDPETGDVVHVTMHDVHELKTSRGAIIAKVAKIESLARHWEESGGDLPTCDEKQWPCSQYKLHQGKASDDDADPYGGFFKPVLEDDSLDRLMGEYLDAAQDEAAARDRKANARKMIVGYVGGEGEDRSTDKYELSWSGTGIKKELDKPALEKYLRSFGKTIDEFYGTKSVSRSIVVKEKPCAE